MSMNPSVTLSIMGEFSTIHHNITHTSNPLCSPERVSTRYENDEEARKASGFTNSTYKTIFDRFDREGADVSYSQFKPNNPIQCLGKLCL